MKRRLGTQALALVLSGGALAAICCIATPSQAQYVAPPPEVIATLVPVYHEGHAVYYYRGYWHWRDRDHWTYYHEEPAYLRDWRAHHTYVYHHYGYRR